MAEPTPATTQSAISNLQSTIANSWHRLLAHSLALAPLLVLLGRWLADDLPINLNRYLLLRSGTVGLILLIAALACTPLALLGWRGAVQVRRPLGVYGFCYMVAHLLVYAVLDNELDWELIVRDLFERQAMTAGLLALILLAPLAFTSTRGWQRRLGRGWRTLHRLVYPAALLVVLHYLWLERDDTRAALAYGIVIVVLLLLRLPPLRQLLGKLRPLETIFHRRAR